MVSLNTMRTKIVVLAAFLLAQAGCRHREEGPPPAEIALVWVEAPKWGNLKRTILQPGFTKPYEQSPIYARVQGYVGEVNVDRGYFVKKGSRLAQLRVPELEQAWKAKEARVKQTEAQVRQAEEGLKAAKANVLTFDALIRETKAAIDKAEAEQYRWQLEYKRSERLVQQGTYDKQTLTEVNYQWQAALAGLEQARARNQFAKAALGESQAKQEKAAADLDAARFSVKVAQADRDQARVWYDFRDIEAPYDGIVTMRNVHPGQFMQVSSSGSTNKAAEPMFHFVSMDPLRVVAQVPEYDALLVKADEDEKGSGSPADISFQGLNDRVISHPVTLKADALDPQARTMAVEIHIKNRRTADPEHPYELLPFMYVNVAIKVETAKSWLLPLQAIYTDGEKSYCFIIEEEQGKSVARKTALRPGVANDAEVQILKKQKRKVAAAEKESWVDFTGNERIVASNPESLLDGQNVRFEGKK